MKRVVAILAGLLLLSAAVVLMAAPKVVVKTMAYGDNSNPEGVNWLRIVAAFDTGVNITLGLPVIRTSVDHGTAYDIAGRGVANPASLLAAVAVAATLVRGRQSPTPSVP